MKKTTLAFLLASLCPLVSANTRDGFYLGAGLGVSSDTYDLKASNLTIPYTVVTYANQTHILGNLFVGGGYTLDNNVFLGGELGTRFPNRQVSVSGLSGISSLYPIYSNTLSVSDYITIDALPGFAINPSLLIYGRAGLSYSELTLKQPIVGSRHGFNINENRWGGRIGVGSNVAINNNLGIAIDYYYSFYQSMNIYSPVFNTHFLPKANSQWLGLSVLYSI